MPEGFLRSPRFERLRNERADQIRLNDVDRALLSGSVGLTVDQWDSSLLTDHQRLTLQEFVSNFLDARYGRSVPLMDADQQRDQNVKQFTEAFDGFVQAVDSLSKSGDITEAKKKLLYALSFIKSHQSSEYNKKIDAELKKYTAFQEFRIKYNDPDPAEPFGSYPGVRRLRSEMLEQMHAYSHLHGSIFRHHDWVHAAQLMAAGESSEAIEHATNFTNPRERYLDRQEQMDELWPSLFLPVGEDRGFLNIPTILRHPAKRRILAGAFQDTYDSPSDDTFIRNTTRELTTMLMDTPATAFRGRRYEYETYMKCIQAIQAHRYGKLTIREARQVYDWFEELHDKGGDQYRPNIYQDLSAQIFVDKPDPLVFVNTLMGLIEKVAK